MFGFSSKKTPASSSDEDDPSSSEEELVPYDKDGYAPKPQSPQKDTRKADRDTAPAADSVASNQILANNEALGLIGQAGFAVKFMAILQNPSKIKAILSASNLKGNLKEHYGSEDPREVAQMIFHDLQDALKNGTWSIGRLAFFGGCYGTVAGVLDLLPPASIFKVFTPLAGINMVFILLFGIVIMTVESSGDTISANLKRTIFHYCKALETIWGRGFFYCYVGATCILAPGHNLFGYYMLCVGLVMLVIYRMTSQHLTQIGNLFKDGAAIDAYFEKHGGIDQSLNRAEVVLLLKEELQVDMGHAELEMLMDRLDPSHDGVITADEMKDALNHHEESKNTAYTFQNIPKLDPSKYKFMVTMQKRLGKGSEQERKQATRDEENGGGSDVSSDEGSDGGWMGGFLSSSKKKSRKGGEIGLKAFEVKGYDIKAHT